MSYNLVNPTTGDLTRVAGGTLYADNPIGSIIPFGSSTIPAGYLLCNGQAVSRTTYSELFAAIGTAFGSGNGSTTFNVPDLRETVPVGVGQNGTQSIETHDVYTLAQFKDDQLQDHRHANTPYVNVADGTYSTAYSHDAPEGYGKTVATGRYGTTTHGKQIGVNYIIKAKHVGIPSDFIDAVDDAIADTTVDTVADGNMSPVTSNAVYDMMKPVIVTITAESGFTSSNETKCFKVGNLCILSFIINGPIAGYTTLATGLPVPATVDGNNRIVNFSVAVVITGTGGLNREVAGEAYVDGNGALFIRGYNGVAGVGQIYGSVTYVCE